ncbi:MULTISPECIES: protein-disulfide reductase DsbD [unclassified Colwellia]|jgi:thiol:disulfide interchange protein DsbD|uniref:protein-disulfide reductase DsbD n=1 Tax=unclassified Colwellia TaxID=196834 RepID=UPI0015F6657E|nr:MULTISPECIES: protein-disulfide reductase DsbD [unclassified Colwellia]MBA6377548.1 protein-disulfide reductase DsbD [Colwellia sp. BRX10-7]MBA6386420.1 protein-disulfide reductase DsbD [Colwellia sp. BRX10-2]MBA6402180.1 protein-disulfide reductase DsbD [Colwellia sp. BRX10-5]MBA6404288.1 protein-disulfide reductase DsbD [Colwellia sp. BRX10-1]
MKKIVLLFWLVLTSIFLQVPNAQAQDSIFDTSSASLFSNDDEFLSVEEAFEFNFHQKDDQLSVSFTIAEGYYLYRHQFKFSVENAEIIPVELPKGEDHEDEFFGVQQIFTEQLNFTIKLVNADSNASIKIRYQGCAAKGLCYPPKSKVVALSKVNNEEAINTNNVLAAISPDNETGNTSIAAENASEQHQLADMLKGDNIWLTLLAFFVGGLLLSFTPCVFPMYPILTGIIVGQGDKLSTSKAFRLSFAYVQGMAITYTLLGIVVALAGAQFQAMFQHPAVLIVLSVLFIFLALSMFGVFNLALPSSWQNKLNNISNSQKGGSYFGVVVMGAISGLVASPCTTAPLTGALLYISQSGDIWLGASALYALSLGMGVPLLVLGSSGGKLLPKAGTWMTVIKNVFGLLLLAVPIFLMERFLPSVVTQAMWAILVLSSAGYFYTVNQQTQNNFWFGVRSVVIFVMIFFGANQAFQLISPSQSVATSNQEAPQQHFTKVATLPELLAAVDNANAQGKTVMVDLYADWCIACKEFEEYTFNAPQVQKVLSNTVWLQIDMTDFDSTDNAEFAEKYQVLGLPSILFFDQQGKELTQQRVTGFMGAEEFTEHLQKIL